MQPTTLPVKFAPYILDDNCQDGEKKALFHKLENIFNSPAAEPLSKARGFHQLGSKPHVVEYPEGLPGWIIKAQRHDGLVTTPDTHIYRVRRADKLRKLNSKHFVIPKKYLYQHNNQWYVIAERVKLENAYWIFNEKQAEDCAHLICSGKMEDVKYENIALTKRNKFVIYDTEPIYRNARKQCSKRFYRFWPLFLATVEFVKIRQELENLKRITDYNAFSGIYKVQNIMFAKHIIKLVALIAIPILTIIGLSYGDIVSSSVTTALKILTVTNGIFASVLIGITTHYHYNFDPYFLYMTLLYNVKS